VPVRVERCDRVLTVIHSRAEARNAVDPEHAEALYEAFMAFDADEAADVAVPEHAALEREWTNCTGTFKAEGAAGATRFAKGAGRHGDGI